MEPVPTVETSSLLVAEAPQSPTADGERQGSGEVVVVVTATPVLDEPANPELAPTPDVKASAPRVPAPTARTAQTTPARKPAAPSWRVQVGAYGSKRAAEEIVGKLAKSGYTATVFSSSGSKYHKVWVQAGSTRASAEAAAARLKGLGYKGSYVVPPPAK